MNVLLVPLKFAAAFWWMLIIYLPGVAGEKLRYYYYKRRLKFIGTGVRISTGVSIDSPGLISIGDNSHIDKDVVLQAALFDDRGREVNIIKNRNYKGSPGEVFIGKNVHVGPGSIIAGNYGGVYISDNCGLSSGVKIYSLSSHYRSKKNPSDRSICFGSRIPPSMQCVFYGGIQLNENVGIALNSVILPGVFIDKDSFVSIGMVIEAGIKIPENTVVNNKIERLSTQRFKVQHE